MRSDKILRRFYNSLTILILITSSIAVSAEKRKIKSIPSNQGHHFIVQQSQIDSQFKAQKELEKIEQKKKLIACLEAVNQEINTARVVKSYKLPTLDEKKKDLKSQLYRLEKKCG